MWDKNKAKMIEADISVTGFRPFVFSSLSQEKGKKRKLLN